MKHWIVWEWVVTSPRGKWHWEPVGLTTHPHKTRQLLPGWRRKFVKFQPVIPINEAK